MEATARALASPLTFAPLYKRYIWGGRKLERLFGRSLPEGDIAESWEISGHPNGPTVVDSGPMAGRDLPSLVARYGVDLVGRRAAWAAERGVFPLLAKILDANHALSVQVHPGDAQAAARRPGELGKTEMWYVLHAEEGARIVHGLRPGTSREALSRALADGRVQDCLRRVPVAAGDAVLVPAGTVHAILSGVVLVEIQQSSDTTYRLYDWNRLDASGRPRPLHAHQALEATDFDGPRAPPQAVPRLLRRSRGLIHELLIECDKFNVERVRLEKGGRFEGRLRGETFEIWGLLSGVVRVTAARVAARVLELDALRFALLPATMGAYEIAASTDAVALRTYLPKTRADESPAEPSPTRAGA